MGFGAGWYGTGDWDLGQREEEGERGGVGWVGCGKFPVKECRGDRLSRTKIERGLRREIGYDVNFILFPAAARVGRVQG